MVGVGLSGRLAVPQALASKVDFSVFCGLLERLPSAAYLCDAGGLIMYFNLQAAELWGRTPCLGQSEDRYGGAHRLFSRDGTPISQNDSWMGRALRERREFNGREVVIERPDGTRRTVLAYANPFYADDGTLLGGLNVLMDITEHRRKDEERRQLQAAILQMSRLRLAGELAAGVGHELNQPLAAIVSYAETCTEMLRRDGSASEEVLAMLQQIAEQGHRAAAIIRRLREFTRRAAPTRAAVSIPRLLRGAADLVAFECRSGGIALELDDGGELPEVCVDAIQAQQVLLNLLRNAIDAMKDTPPDERRIRVQAELKGGDRVLITVSDHGPGVARCVRDHLYFPFITTRADGIGLGLPISKSIVEAHGGDLWLDEGEGRGARFRFTLPVAGARTGDNKPAAPSSTL